MSNTSEILVVMVHVWEDMPELENIRWQEFVKKVVDKANAVEWPKIWQFDFVDTKTYTQMPWQKIVAGAKTTEGGKIPHPDIVFGSNDWISTSDEQTAQLIKLLDPKIVMFGGLHKDLCVTGVKLAVEDDQREYFVSELLGYTWKETASAIYKDW